MLRRDNHEGDSEEGVTSGRIDAEAVIGSLDREVDESTLRPSNPVYLLLLDILGIIDILQALEQLVCVLCDAEIPDLLRELNDIIVADIALAALGILVGEDNLAVRAVIDKCRIAEHKPVLEQLEEDPLGPLVIVLICCVDYAAPVK
jgi:hypothetical protein